MRRLLVLTNEAARHSFRQSLPRSMFTMPATVPSRSPLSDRELFLLTFVAGFLGFSAFFA